MRRSVTHPYFKAIWHHGGRDEAWFGEAAFVRSYAYAYAYAYPYANVYMCVCGREWHVPATDIQLTVSYRLGRKGEMRGTVRQRYSMNYKRK